MARKIVLLLLTLCVVQFAQAHRFAPSLLKVTETASGQFNMVWKTPAQGTSNIPLRPTWPDSCTVSNASPPQMEGTGKVSSLQLNCEFGPDGLIGQQLGVSGLGANQASAMLMVSLLDGRSYQEVLNAQEAVFVVPAEPSTGEVMGDYSVLGIDHIWSGIDHLLFVFGLLLLAGLHHGRAQYYLVAGDPWLL